jgi:AbrB family looped-hinge helix DNA binding protein
MKKYPKIVQSDSRGQIVIPKDIRRELGIEEGTGFYMYTITDEGILLKKIDAKDLGENKKIIDELTEKAKSVGIDPKNISKSVKKYRKTKEGGLEEVR